MQFDHYPLEKRKKIAIRAAVAVGVILIGVLIFVYTRPMTEDRQGLSTIITNGYTTIIESTQSYFTK